MANFKETTNISLKKTIDLKPHHQSAVQKANIGSKYIYCLQLRNEQSETYVLRGLTGDTTNTILHLTGVAAGHTQTWEFAGIDDNWFIGTKKVVQNDEKTIPKEQLNWDKQIARVNIKSHSGLHKTNLDFPRLAYLNRAGSSPYPGKNFVRAEVAVSPNHQSFLLATIDTNGTSYFTIYALSTINNALDKVASLSDDQKYVSMEFLPYIESFTCSNITSLINSFQGYDLDNYGNIYISSQKAPKLKNGSWTTYHKQIIKIPSSYRTQTTHWTSVNLSDWGKLDIAGHHSEVEGIQVIGENHVYLTVAYHQNVDGKSVTTKNKLYELSWQ